MLIQIIFAWKINANKYKVLRLNDIHYFRIKNKKLIDYEK
jgi:hypothetical protein